MKWFFEHIISPIIIVVIGIYINNYYIEKQKPYIVVETKTIQTIKVGEAKYKINSPFTIENKGGSISKDIQLTLLMSGAVKIDDFDLPTEYKSYFELLDGGKGHSFLLLLLKLPKGKKITGTISFYSNIKIPSGSNSPLRTFY